MQYLTSGIIRTLVFNLNQNLSKDSIYVAKRDIFQIRLMNDERFFWVVIVPELPNASELHDLNPESLNNLFLLAAHLGKLLKTNRAAKKINTAILGNIICQLHIHIVVRFENDPAWPGPVWGFGKPIPTPKALIKKRTDQLLEIIETFNEK